MVLDRRNNTQHPPQIVNNSSGCSALLYNFAYDKHQHYSNHPQPDYKNERFFTDAASAGAQNQ